MGHAKELVKKTKDMTLENTPILLIANKTDKGNQRTVQRVEYEEFCEENGLKLFELSAALFTNTLDIAFEEIYRQLYLSNTSNYTSDSPLVKRKKKHAALKEVS